MNKRFKSRSSKLRCITAEVNRLTSTKALTVQRTKQLVHSAHIRAHIRSGSRGASRASMQHVRCCSSHMFVAAQAGAHRLPRSALRMQLLQEAVGFVLVTGAFDAPVAALLLFLFLLGGCAARGVLRPPCMHRTFHCFWDCEVDWLAVSSLRAAC